MGMNPDPWTPAEVGRITALSESLAPLTPHINDISVVTNLEISAAHTTGNHASANASFLTCVKPKRTEGSDYVNSTSVDQIAAKQIGGETPLPSLEIGTDLIAQVGNCDNGYACVYMNSLSWASPTSRIRPRRTPGLSLNGCSETVGRRSSGRRNCARTAAFSTGCSTTSRACRSSSVAATAPGRRICRNGSRGGASHPAGGTISDRIAAERPDAADQRPG